MAVLSQECTHANTILIAVPVSGSDRPQYKHVCVECGTRLSPIKHSELSAEEKDEAVENARALEESHGALMGRSQSASGQAAARVFHNRLRDDPRYQAYLRSPEWADLRALVLYRDGGTCRGCGTRRATDAHHLSYTHLYHEFLFELVAVCRLCHERWHQR